MDSEKTPKKDQDSNHNMKPEKVFGYLLFIASACGIIWALGAGISLISQKKTFNQIVLPQLEKIAQGK